MADYKWCIYAQDEALENYHFDEWNDDTFPFETHQEAVSFVMKKFYSEGHYGPWYIEKDPEEETYYLFSMRYMVEDMFVPDRKFSWINFVREEIQDVV